jgi:hypothetical protein
MGTVLKERHDIGPKKNSLDNSVSAGLVQHRKRPHLPERGLHVPAGIENEQHALMLSRFDARQMIDAGRRCEDLKIGPLEKAPQTLE